VSELEPENESRGVGAGTGARIWRTGVGNVSRQMCRERFSGRARNRGRRGGWAQGSRQVCREQISGQELRAGVGADIENGVGCEEMGPAVGTKYLNGR